MSLPARETAVRAALSRDASLDPDVADALVARGLEVLREEPGADAPELARRLIATGASSVSAATIVASVLCSPSS